MSIIIYSINVSGSKGLKYTFYNKSIAKSKPLNDLLRGNIRIKIEANKWSAERNKMHTKLYAQCTPLNTMQANKSTLCFEKTSSASDSSLLSSFYVWNQTPTCTFCASHRKKKKERKKLSDKALYISPNYWSYSKV